MSTPVDGLLMWSLPGVLARIRAWKMATIAEFIFICRLGDLFGLICVIAWKNVFIFCSWIARSAVILCVKRCGFLFLFFGVLWRWGLAGGWFWVFGFSVFIIGLLLFFILFILFFGYLLSYWSISVAPVRGGTYFLCRGKES
ncbi:hypothetical protein P3T18_004096 [Paraburkholderia sp. GAS199]|uniref:hypothetical protein n=1 Tax=Paraburkholderia sp. GAS199 TaxID=3035126 RepID=UPI003D20A4F0